VVAAAVTACGDTPKEQPQQKHAPISSKLTHFVSMAPSNTELIYAIGAQDQLIGVCNQCDFPPGVKSKTIFGDFTHANLEKLATIQPDGVLLVDGQEAMQSTIEKQSAFRPRVVMVHNVAIRDIASNLRSLGLLTGRYKQAFDLADQFDEGWRTVERVTRRTSSKPKVFFCVWPEPLMTIGNSSYLNDAITVCGGTNIAANLDGAYPRFSVEKLIVEDPDVIIMPAEADHSLATKPPWSKLKAVKNQHLYFLPPRKDDRLSRPTVRVLEGLFWLAERIHPEFKEQLSINKNSISHLLTTTSPNP
jgi:iron complex transport system substrate-binding protein